MGKFLSAYRPRMRHPNYRAIGKRFRRKAGWSDDEPLMFLGEKADIYNLSFISANAHFLPGHNSYRCKEHDLLFPGEPTIQQPGDASIAEKINFCYPQLLAILKTNDDVLPASEMLNTF